MKPTRPSDVTALFREIDFRPSRVLGQNFLVDGNILDITMDAAQIARDDVVLEIGPGLGVLTGPLLSRAAKVVAIEKDPKLFAFLQTRFSGELNLDLEHGDATEVNLDEILEQGVTKVVANLPYSVASRLLVDLCHSPRRPLRIVVTVQEEVADRITASPNNKRFGVLSVFTQMHYDPTIRKRIRPTCFFPPPKITSSLMILERLKHPRSPLEDPDLYRTLVRTAFAQRRKKVSTTLALAPAPLRISRDDFTLLAERLGIKPNARPENLRPEQFGALANALVSRARKEAAGRETSSPG